MDLNMALNILAFVGVAAWYALPFLGWCLVGKLIRGMANAVGVSRSIAQYLMIGVIVIGTGTSWAKMTIWIFT